MKCNGKGSDGDHCCVIKGEVCQFLFVNRGGVPRCMIFEEQPTPEWEEAPVGKWFAENYPGFNCRDWPQNIPEVMEEAKEMGPFYICCWGRGNA